MMDNPTIFYSWQSDHRATKNFIDKTLKAAISDLSVTGSLEKSPRLDKDTQDTIGSPSIVNTIKSKIDKCGIFVADISIIDESKLGRKLVNQNVMFELGYAIAKHTEDNVIMLFNSDLGDPKLLPFDISHHRVLRFSVIKDKDGIDLKNKLIGALTAHLNYLKVKEIQSVEQSLDDIQLLIMKVYAKMSDDKRIMVSSTMSGPSIFLIGGIDSGLSDQLDAIDQQELVANLEDLASKEILTIGYGSKGTPNFKLSKTGFEIIKVLNKSID